MLQNRREVGEGFAFEVLHHRVVDTVRFPRREACTCEASSGTIPRAPPARTSGATPDPRTAGEKHFDVDHPVEPRVLCTVDLALPAAPDGGQDLVGSEPTASEKRHWRVFFSLLWHFSADEIPSTARRAERGEPGGRCATMTRRNGNYRNLRQTHWRFRSEGGRDV